MITKERLETLIREGATIYTSRFKKPEKYKLYKDYFIDKDKLCACNKSHTAIECVIKLDKLFETEEDAEFALRFKRIPRTEELSLPTWEEFCKLVNEDIRFYRNEYTYILQSCYYSSGEETIELFERYYDYGNILFKKPLTKENYLLACELCRKLWLGEEV